ncbi:unnamed protein product [Haemonchus placei]|uniref:Transposase n=1 Tax=Haemonchus placei TaxID=6290 RepID=A0A0N4W9J8_HAEPC|nr:unnamed protein product [Haemonchus placei]
MMSWTRQHLLLAKGEQKEQWEPRAKAVVFIEQMVSAVVPFEEANLGRELGSYSNPAVGHGSKAMRQG